MPDFAPLFDANTLPKNTTPLTERAVTNALVGTTVGAAAGSATSVTKARVPHTVDNAGKKNAEVITPINRNSTAADVTAMKSKFTKKKASFAYARDLSGNGGPAFTRT